jgi:hypothetical protein
MAALLSGCALRWRAIGAANGAADFSSLRA